MSNLGTLGIKPKEKEEESSKEDTTKLKRV